MRIGNKIAHQDLIIRVSTVFHHAKLILPKNTQRRYHHKCKQIKLDVGPHKSIRWAGMRDPKQPHYWGQLWLCLRSMYFQVKHRS